MKKTFNLFLVFLITFFSIPFGSFNVHAEGNNYIDIADGNNVLTAKLLKAGTNQDSAAAGFMSNQVGLKIEKGEAELTFFIPNKDEMLFTKFELEGKAPKIVEGTGIHKGEETQGKFYTFPLETIKKELDSIVSYEVPFMDLKHDDIPMDIELFGLEDLPKASSGSDSSLTEEEENSESGDTPSSNEGSAPAEGTEDGTPVEEGEQTPSEGEKPESGDKPSFEEDYTPAEDQRVVGDLVTEEEADQVQLYEFDTDSRATKGQLVNPVTLLEKDGETYLQITVSPRGFKYFKSLKFNGEEVVWNNTEQAPVVIQYKLDSEALPLSEEEAIDVSMVIDTGQMVMPHGNIKLWLSNTYNEIDLDKQVEVSPNERMVIGNGKDSLKTPNNLLDDVTLTVTSKTEEVKGTDLGDLILAGEVYEFSFENLAEGHEAFELVMNYDAQEFNSEEYDVDIYYFNGSEWEPQKAHVENGVATLKVDHFSTYGVFATEKTEAEEEPEAEVTEPEKGTEAPSTNLVPDKAYEIEYMILKENGKGQSIADEYFKKPGILIEKDGKLYLQMTATSASMIKSFGNKYGEALVVQEDKKKDEKVLQLQVNKDLSDMELNMHIIVNLGDFKYDTNHNAILTFNQDTKKEIPVEDVTLAASADKANKNGPFVKEATPKPVADNQPSKPSPKVKKGDNNPSNKGKLNPDKAYEIDYVIYKEDADQVSIADDFFKKPGILLEKDGKRYLQVEVTSWSMVDYLKYNGKNVRVISYDKASDIAKVQFEVTGKLTNAIPLDMKITVPGLYSQGHGARLVMFPDTMKEIDPEGHVIYDDTETADEDAEHSNTGTSNKTPEKPEFDESTDKQGEKPSKMNPKTGDKSQVIIFSSLLLLSLVVLVVQVRRRLAA